MRTASGAEGFAGDFPGLSVVVTPRPPSVRLVLTGELDLRTAGVLTGALERVERSSWCRFEVDLEGVAFADCTGVRPLVGLSRLAAERGGEVVLWGPSPRVALVLAHLGLLRGAPGAPAVSRRAGDLLVPRCGG